MGRPFQGLDSLWECEEDWMETANILNRLAFTVLHSALYLQHKQANFDYFSFHVNKQNQIKSLSFMAELGPYFDIIL